VKECSKAIVRRLHTPDFTRLFFVGGGLDIGGHPDPLALYTELFPGIVSLRTWDRADGDAQHLEGVADESFDFVHSSHCLEHLDDPAEGLESWLRVLREEGHMIVSVPDEDLYEQGVFPSTFNTDHKWTFTVRKKKSWSARSLNVLDLIGELGETADLVRLERLTSTYRFDLPRYDQTLTPVGESGIEFVVRKRVSEETRRAEARPQPTAEARRHLNQYRDDQQTLREANRHRPPFLNEESIE
jgi:SAM-dependent methyltransferase